MTSTLLQSLAKSKVAAKKEARKLDIADLEKLIGHLNDALTEVKNKAAEKARQKRLADIKKINALLAASGLQPKDLAADSKKNKTAKKSVRSKRSVVLPKYRLVIDGQEYLWSGRGRTPKVFQDYFDAGNSRLSCAIK